MTSEIHVYDPIRNAFRQLNTQNYSDDMQIGIIYFRRTALAEIEQICTLCGYIAIPGNDKIYYPIDIQKEKIAMLEGTYNSMPREIKKAISKHNIYFNTDIKLSNFFYSWQLEGRFDCFEKNGPFVELCSIILEDDKYIDSLRNSGSSLYVPSDYYELCEMTRRITGLFQFDYARISALFLINLVRAT